MQTIKRVLAALWAALLALTLWPVATCAAGVDAGFTVRAILPDNQLDPEAGYFDLRIPPGQRQTLLLLVENPGPQEITVQVEAVPASTNRGGAIAYLAGADTGDTPSFSQLAHIEEPELRVSPHGAVQVPVEVVMPAEAHEGLLMGAVRVLKLPGEEEASETGITNLFSYVIGVRLHGTDTDPSPDFALEGVTLELVNHKASLVAGLRNTRPVLVEDAQVSMQVATADGSPVIQRTLEAASFAPGAVLPMTLTDQAGYGFAAGDYLATVEVRVGERLWEFSHPFTLEREETAAVNGAAVNQYQNPPDPSASGAPLPLLLLTTCLVAAVTALFLHRRRH